MRINAGAPGQKERRSLRQNQELFRVLCLNYLNIGERRLCLWTWSYDAHGRRRKKIEPWVHSTLIMIIEVEMSRRALQMRA